MIFTTCLEPTITGFPSESRANEGEEVVIKPKVEGHPPPSLTWHHDGRKVTADYATELDQDGGLSFPCVEAKHAGESSTGCTRTLRSCMINLPQLGMCSLHISKSIPY